MLAVDTPFRQFFDLTGAPLQNGYLYFGTSGQNPETNPVTVYWDAAGTQPAAQPIRTLNGFAVRNGTPAVVYAAMNYSLTVRNKSGAIVCYVQNSGEFNTSQSLLTMITDFIANVASSIGASLVGFIQAGAGAVARLVQTELRESYCPMQYGAVGNGVADDTAALTNCWAACPAHGVIDLRGKTYRLTAPIPRPAVGVTVRNGKVFLDNPAAFFIYAFVANDFCRFEDIYFLGTGAVGTTTGVTFTASVGGATAGTLTAGIADGTYIFTFSNGNTRYVTVAGGTAVTWTGALAAGNVTAATYPATPRYQGGIFGGNTGYAAPMNTTPANGVTVTGCTFDNLTVGVWSGGANGDPVPTGWKVHHNTFQNIVGVPSLSEGYGCLFTPANNSVCANNYFSNIRRHAFYGAGEWSNCVVSGNIIDGCDNIAIQSNTGVTQNYADGNVIANNTIRGLTRSVPYGYRSSVGIGLYGKVKNTVVDSNKIFGALDTGIDTAGALSGSAYSDRLQLSSNQIIMDPTATDSGIRLDNLQSGKVFGNNILLQASNNGFTITSSVSALTTVIDVSDNTVETTVAGAVGFRVALATPRTLRVFRNTLNGFANVYTNKINDTSSAGIVKTDLNSNVGFFGADAGFTHNAGGTIAITDCPAIRHTGTLTAARDITLANTNVPDGARVTIMRPGGGAFALNVKDGGTIKALSTGQWAQFGWNGVGWEELAFGSL